jgi:hypothetical protein|tara:strand:- start:848 stop:1111 length:264 start_codon:yes stop_codon:yes gene_type:complete
MRKSNKMLLFVGGFTLLSASVVALGMKMKEKFDMTKFEKKEELKGFENLETINEEPPKDFKPKKESKLEFNCNSNAEEAGEKMCQLY